MITETGQGSTVGGDLAVVGEDDRARDEFGTVDGFELPDRIRGIESEPRVGGRLRIDIEEEGSEFYVTGEYLVLDRPGRLSFTWSCSTWPDPGLRSVVTVLLERARTATR